MLKHLFKDFWPGGINSLRAYLISEGFDDLELEAFDGLEWPVENELRNYYKASGENRKSWGFLAKDSKNEWPSEFAMIFAHFTRKKDLPENVAGHIFWTAFPEAALDKVLQQLSGKLDQLEWTSKPPSGVSLAAGLLLPIDVVIGEGTFVEPGVVLGRNVKIGKDCRIAANAVIGDDSIIGDGCDIGSCTVIGGHGFGIIDCPRTPKKKIRKHVGRVRIGNNVILGSHVSIDRAVFGETVLEDEVCLDNHVQIAHNCYVGAQSAFCAFSGLSGSTKVGKRCVFAGAAGTKGHLTIGDDVVIGAQSGITTDLASNQFVKGYPPRPIQEALKIESLKTRLPEIYSRLKKLEKQITEK